MKKMIGKILSYVLVAALASGVSFWIADRQNTPEWQKLHQLEALLEEKFIGGTDSVALTDGAADGMVAALGDRWSYYVPASEYAAFEEQKNNAYVGVGMTIQLAEEDTGILVIQVTEGGPAEEAGVLAGDLLIAVEGQDIRGWTTDAVRDVVKGEENTYVQLTFLREGEQITLSVQRRIVKTPVATGMMLEGNVGLVTIYNFDARCAEESIAAMESLFEQGAEKLVLDVHEMHSF